MDDKSDSTRRSQSSEELELRQHCRKFRITSETVDVLCGAGFNSLALFSIMTSQNIQTLGLEESDQQFAVETAVMAAKRTSQLLPVMDKGNNDSTANENDNNNADSKPKTLSELQKFLLSIEDEGDEDTNEVLERKTDNDVKDSERDTHSTMEEQHKQSSGETSSEDEDSFSEYEILNPQTLEKPEAKTKEEESEVKQAPLTARQKLGTPPKPRRRTTKSQGHSSVDHALNADTEKTAEAEKPSVAKKPKDSSINKENKETDGIYSQLAAENQHSIDAEESSYMAISKTTAASTVSHGNTRHISDDPVCLSTDDESDNDDTDKTTKGDNVYEQGTLLMHKNSVYHKDLIITPSMDTTKMEKNKEDSGKTLGGASTGSKTLSSGSEDSYERVEPPRNNSVMIYDDVVAPKDQGQPVNGKEHARNKSLCQSEWNKTMNDMDGMLQLYDSVQGEGDVTERQPQRSPAPYEVVHMYSEVNEAEMRDESGEYSEIPKDIIRKFRGSVQKLPPMQSLIDEIVTTETEYVSKLDMLDKKFQTRLTEENARKHIMPETDISTMLSTLPLLHVLHGNRLLPSLQEQLQKCSKQLKPHLAEVMKTLVAELELYTKYATTLDRAVHLMTFWKQRNVHFAKIVNEIQKLPACGIVPLHIHLFEPLLRLTAYQGYLKKYIQCLKHSNTEEESKERKIAHDVLEKITDVSDEANNAVKDAEERVRREELERRLGPGIVQGTSGELLHEGSVRGIHPKTTQIQTPYLFLFSDVLLVTQPYKGPSGDDYKVQSKIPLAELKMLERPYGKDEKTLVLTSNDRFLELLPDEKTRGPLDKWIAVLTSAIEKLPKEETTQMEVIGTRCPVLERFQDYTACMQCADPFKRSRNKHHCKGCGKVVCPNCSSHTVRMRYRKKKPRRVCDECYVLLCKRRTSSVDQPTLFLNYSPTSPREQQRSASTSANPVAKDRRPFPKPDLLKSHTVSSDTATYDEPFQVDTPQSTRSDSNKPPGSLHSKSSSIDSQISKTSSSSNSSRDVDQDDRNADSEVFEEYSEINPKFPLYSVVLKQGDAPQLTFAKEIAESKREKAEEAEKREDVAKRKMSEGEKPVPMRRSLSRNTRLTSSPENEKKIQENKPSPKEKPKAGGWMKLLRKMSTGEPPQDLHQMTAAEISNTSPDGDRKMSTGEKATKQKQVAAVRLPSAMPGEAWMGVVAEFKGRSVDDETQDEVETMSF